VTIEHPLDNAAWHALIGPHRVFAEGSALAKRYDPDVSPIAAIADEPSRRAWSELAALTGPGRVTSVFRDDVAPPAGWQVIMDLPTVQMVLADTAPLDLPDDWQADELGPADAQEMLDLVELTKPGPFRPRTGELGRYIGIHRRGALVAMAGERLHLDGYTEVSAVCTHPDHRGQGLGANLTIDVARGIRERGETPILHAAHTNAGAIRIYQRLGFELRRHVKALVVRVPETG
jgi:ribosomal protein S18 acetylase RimI-like enzyme